MVLVVNGIGGFLVLSPFLISSTRNFFPSRKLRISSISARLRISVLPFWSWWNLAVMGFLAPGALSPASRLQYSSGIKAAISSSRSQIIRRATDWTRPALNPLFTFSQRIGLMLYPTIRSSIRLACWASTRFISMALGSFKDVFTAFFVISLKLIRYTFLSFTSSSFSAFNRCQEMASPSRSGSVAR